MINRLITLVISILVVPLFAFAQVGERGMPAQVPQAEDPKLVDTLVPLHEVNAPAIDTTSEAPITPTELAQRITALENRLNAPQNRVRLTGFVQLEYQRAEKDAQVGIGNPVNEHPESPYNRIGIRRARIRIAYSESLFNVVYQIDMTERGIGLRDAFVDLLNPWTESCFVRTGLFFRPFGFEMSYTSQRRESPERATIIRTLFPQYRDLGAMVVLQAPASSPWSILRFEGGLFAGNGINWESDSRRDFIGRLMASQNQDAMSWRVGTSYYYGSVYQGTANLFRMQGGEFVLDNNPTNLGRYARREYVGLEGEYSYQLPFGRTLLRGEYIWGQQPGSSISTLSPVSSQRPTHDTYLRKLRGGYVYFLQQIGESPFHLTLKYDWYDPNTQLRGDEIGTPSGSTFADLTQRTFAFGGRVEFSPTMLVMAYYEIVRNETSQYVPGFEANRKANLFTMRLQLRF